MNWYPSRWSEGTALSTRTGARAPQPPPAPGAALHLLLAGTVLSVCFVAGGSPVQSNVGIFAAQWLALPLLIWSIASAWHTRRLWPARWAVLVAVWIALLPLLQLLPLPEALWKWAPARVALLHDLTAAGVTHIDYRWSLLPTATERDLYLLLPALALYFAALALGREAWRRLLWWLIGLIVFSAALAFAQVGAPADSVLNPYHHLTPALAGVFANRNHQGSALAIGLVLALALLLDARRRAAAGASTRAGIMLYAVLVALFALMLPLVRSRAGVINALVVGAIVLLYSGSLSLARLRASPSARLSGAATLLILLIGLWAAFFWMQSEVDFAGTRWTLFVATLQHGFDNAPWGSGFGSFVPMFEQATRGALIPGRFVNAAHNDYVQWWFDGGVLAVAVVLAALAAWLAMSCKLLQMPRSSRTRTLGLMAASGLLVLLLHSTVDYPLRTPALMAVAGLLGGILSAAATRCTTNPKSFSSKPDPATSAIRNSMPNVARTADNLRDPNSATLPRSKRDGVS